jgi:regulatory protein
MRRTFSNRRVRIPERDARSPKPGALSSQSAYLAALTMLARRELSEAQIRQRLARREYDRDAINEAVERLKHERAIDDERVAGAIARTAAAVKRRGRARVKREIEQAGIASSVARSAVDATFADIDEGRLLDAALARRLPKGAVDERARARLYRYLIGQGFDHDRVLRSIAKLPRT